MERTFLYVVPHGVHAHDQGLQIKTAGLFPGQILQAAAQAQGGRLRQCFAVVLHVNPHQADGVPRHFNGIGQVVTLGVDGEIRNINRKSVRFGRE